MKVNTEYKITNKINVFYELSVKEKKVSYMTIFLKPKLSLRFSPNNTKNMSNEDRSLI